MELRKQRVHLPVAGTIDVYVDLKLDRDTGYLVQAYRDCMGCWNPAYIVCGELWLIDLGWLMLGAPR